MSTKILVLFESKSSPLDPSIPLTIEQYLSNVLFLHMTFSFLISKLTLLLIIFCGSCVDTRFPSILTFITVIIILHKGLKKFVVHDIIPSNITPSYLLTLLNFQQQRYSRLLLSNSCIKKG